MGEEVKKGKVYLVGAGPGDKRLLTIKALEVLQIADVILYDRLVNPLLLESSKVDAELVYCGKLPDRHILRQEAINEKLVQFGKENKIVVRLKGGDPSVFGRVAEEIEALETENIPYEVIPGITAGIAAATYAGISVTHRQHGGSFAVVTGHNKTEDGKPTVDWHSLAKGIDTIAFYMGVSNLSYISNQLLLNGKKSSTPVSIIQWGTLGKQKVVTGTLENITEKAKLHHIQNPAITLVGDVNQLRKNKSWFEKQPLFGRHILFVKTSSEHSETAQALTDLGADVFEFPRWNWNEVHSKTPLWSDYEEILFLSPTIIDAFFEKIRKEQIDIRFIKAKFLCLSELSKRQLQKYGCQSQKIRHWEPTEQSLVIGDAIYDRQKWQEKWSNADYVSLGYQEIVPQSIQTFRRLWDEERIETIVFPNIKAIKVFVDALKEASFSVEDVSKCTEIICYSEEIANIARAYQFKAAKVNATLKDKHQLIDRLLTIEGKG
ncbi:uroporphyrinogen-III C-methyltransferase [Alkalihalobacillus trypoxylicola]|uniref:uroporphyrinogen-III C-methyltransferase n=1 Tax=Alkalihalobacillus trypoxylicola TaxID=519424 RepID=UPI000ACA221C|nr:uroporphyrinogen-III C-methyltransferase [Alkalihalobacillus trypoxylicola]